MIVHAGGVTWALQRLRRDRETTLRFWPITWLFIPVAGWMVLLHLLEISVWTFFYAAAGAMPDLQSAFYVKRGDLYDNRVRRPGAAPGMAAGGRRGSVDGDPHVRLIHGVLRRDCRPSLPALGAETGAMSVQMLPPDARQPASKETLASWLKPSMYWLLVFVPISVALERAHVPPPVLFFSAALAILPIARLIVVSTEQLATRTGDAIGGLLNATFGNARN